MFNENTTMTFDGETYSIFPLCGTELDKLYDKYGGIVNVKISKPVQPGTEEQNRAMHALLSAYYVTGLHSAPEGSTLYFFKVYIKLQYGPCYEITHKEKWVCIPKSWSDYSKDERREFIDALISEIHQSGAYVVSLKIREIIEGMQNET